MICDELSEQDIHGPAVVVVTRDAGTLTLKPTTGKTHRKVRCDKAEFYRGNTKESLDSLKTGEKIYAQTNPDGARLILDEAASALDPESEAIFINNLSRIAVGRTVVMISHRLSTLVNADKIMVMQQGRLMDSGRHADLLTRSETYKHLWNQQTSHL